MKTYSGLIKNLKPNQIFVFGSNTQGRHGAGAAYSARTLFGAIYGCAKGWQGQSYAICTKDLTKEIHPSISSDIIIEQIKTLYKVARDNKDFEFMIAYTGGEHQLNLSGYTNPELVHMFLSAGEIPDNIIFEKEFYQLFAKSQT